MTTEKTDEIRKYLTILMAKRTGSSCEEVANRFTISESTLRKYFPEECHKLAEIRLDKVSRK